MSDFVIGKYTFEVGGRKKQIENIHDAYRKIQHYLPQSFRTVLLMGKNKRDFIKDFNCDLRSVRWIGCEGLLGLNILNNNRYFTLIF